MLDSRSAFDGANKRSDATGSLLDAPRAAMDLPAPQKPATQIDELSYRIPFVFPKGSDQDGAVRVELFCSDDQGATWGSYASISAGDGKTAFLFEAPEPGEYWFVLKTYFHNGKTALSSTRAYHFGNDEEPTLGSLVDDDNDNFLLSNDEDDADIAPQPLLDADEDLAYAGQLYIDETSAGDELPESDAAQADQADQVVPYPGKFRAVTLGKEEGTDKLMAFVRWFKPEDLDAQYRNGVKTLRVETGPFADGPWTLVGRDLDPAENGYGWVLSAEEMKPFFIRIVAEDEKGKVYKTEVSPTSLDVSAVDLRSFLGRVVTPTPLPNAKSDAKSDSATSDAKANDSEPTEHSAKKPGDAAKVSRIDTTSSSDEKETTDAAHDEGLDDIDERSKALKSPEESPKPEKRTYVPPKERPYVPAPTDPNRMEFNPLFTRGVGVLYRSAQTRHVPSNSAQKRSIFTPPSQTTRVAQLPPAEYRRSPAEIARINAQKEQERMMQQAQYMREHEMETFNEKPELMEGRVFYMDENGNMTTTPPASFLQAQNNWQVTNVGEPVPVGDGQVYGGNGSMMTDPNGQQLFMPQNTDEYDASARSGAAIMQQDTMNAASGSSPLNQRYSNGTQQQQQSQPATPQMVPNTSYSRSYSPSTIPYNYQAAPAQSPSAFPPRPTVAY